MRVEKKYFQEWLGELRLTRRQLRSAMQGKQRTRLRSSINERSAKKMAEFSNGRPASMLQKVLKKRRAIDLLERIELPDGNVETDPERINQAAKEYFFGAFAQPVLNNTMRQLFEDTEAGKKRRQKAADGELTDMDRGDIPVEDWDLLKSMWLRKAQQAGDDDILDDLKPEEWVEHFQHLKRTSSPGGSGNGPSVFREAPPEFTRLCCSIYSSIISLKVIPAQWKLETIVPIPKKQNSKRLLDLRPLKLLEVARKAVFAIINRRMQRAVEKAGLLSSRQFGFRSLRGCSFAGIATVAAFEDAIRHRRELHAVFFGHSQSVRFGLPDLR
jgi:hypothetical protein